MLRWNLVLSGIVLLHRLPWSWARQVGATVVFWRTMRGLRFACTMEPTPSTYIITNTTNHQQDSLKYRRSSPPKGSKSCIRHTHQMNKSLISCTEHTKGCCGPATTWEPAHRCIVAQLIITPQGSDPKMTADAFGVPKTAVECSWIIRIKTQRFLPNKSSKTIRIPTNYMVHSTTWCPLVALWTYCNFSPFGSCNF